MSHQFITQVSQQNFNAAKTKTWRKNLNLLHGTALGNSEGESTLSAYVDLVAYGIAKHVTPIQLSKFLEEKGLDVCDCKLLTTFERARTRFTLKRPKIRLSGLIVLV